MNDDEKTCPFCAETIKAAAVVCKHCGRDLPANAKPPTPDEQLMAEHGITWQEDRYMWRGVYFKHLPDAVNYAKHNKNRPDNTVRGSTATEAKPVKWWLWGPLSAVGMFFVWALVRTPSPEENAQRRAEQVIDYCWKEQGESL